MGLQTSSLIGQLADHGVPHSKALVAGFTGGEFALVASGALVTPWAGHALHTGALTCRTMALLAGDSPRVTITSMTLDLWIPPEKLSALPTRLATKTGFTQTLSCDLIAGGAGGVDGVAVAGLAARPAVDVPRIGGAAVAVLTHHVGLAGALTAALITLTLIRGRTGPRRRAHRVTHALPAALCCSVAVVTLFAVLTPVALSVVQAFETGARPSVTGARVVHVDVVVALAGQAAPTGHQRVPEITRSTLITPGTFVASGAHTHQLVSVGQKVTAVRKLPSTARSIGAHAGAAVAT